MRKIINILDLYILFWLLYYLQSILLPNLRILSVGILLFNTCISIFYFFYANLKFRIPLYLKGLNCLLIMLVFYGILRIIVGENIPLSKGGFVDSTLYLKNILISILPIYVFYVYARNGILTSEKISKWLLVFFFACILGFINYKRVMILHGHDGEITNNGGYYFCSLLPAIVLIKNKKIRFIYLIMSFFFILAGMKRGAILTGTLAILFYFVYMFKVTPRSKKVRNLILIIIFLSLMGLFIGYFLSTSEYFVNRVEATREGDSSGRNEFYSFFITHFLYEASDWQQIFGLGADGTIKIFTDYAHCDWLELLTNQGLVGITVYFVYWICFFISVLHQKSNTTIYISLMVFIIIYSLKSIFSMSYMDMQIYSTISLGYCIAQEHRK